MSGWWLASYAFLWLILAVLCLLVVGILRELGMVRRTIANASPNLFDSGPAVGSQLPRMTLHPAQGSEPVELDPGSGEQVLLVFLTATCAGCHSAAEHLEHFLATPKSRHAKVAVVLCGPREACDAFLTVYALPTFVTIDEDYAIPNSLGVRMYPSAFLYDSTGRLVRKGMIANEEDLADVIDGLEAVEPLHRLHV